MRTGTMLRNHGFPALMGLIPLLISLLFIAPGVLAEANKTYVNRQHGFSFHYPAVYELKGTGGDLDFLEGGKPVFSLRVDERFIENLYQMLHPGIVMFRAGEDPYKELAQETRKNQELFRRYARDEARNWCSADGCDGSNYCRDFQSERLFVSRNGFACLELFPLMIREDFAKNTKQEGMVGPVFAVCLPKENRPVVLMFCPLHGRMAPPGVIHEVREIIDSLAVTH